MLKIDDKYLPQSGAIYRYLAREFNLVGDNPLHAAFADMLVETLNDHIYKFPFIEPDEQKRVRFNVMEIQTYLCRGLYSVTVNRDG